ncbi:MAG: alcohol dehydrogenase, partial [Aquiluna sp.]
NQQKFNAMNVVTSLRSIAGINTGNIADTQEMLDFCGEHNIVSDIELLDCTEASAVDEAYRRVIDSDVRYRFVIDSSTI